MSPHRTCEMQWFKIEPLIIQTTKLYMAYRIYSASFDYLERPSGSLILPTKVRDYVFTVVGLCVCLSVTTITKKLWTDLYRILWEGSWEKGRPSSCFVMIGRGMWK